MDSYFNFYVISYDVSDNYFGIEYWYSLLAFLELFNENSCYEYWFKGPIHTWCKKWEFKHELKQKKNIIKDFPRKLLICSKV